MPIKRSKQGVLRLEADRVANLVGLSPSCLHRLKIEQRISQDASVCVFFRLTKVVLMGGNNLFIGPPVIAGPPERCKSGDFRRTVRK